MSDHKSATLYVVQTPKGDRLYVSTHLPQSYVDHVETTGETAEIYEIYVKLPTGIGSITVGPLSDPHCVITRKR